MLFGFCNLLFVQLCRIGTTSQHFYLVSVQEGMDKLKRKEIIINYLIKYFNNFIGSGEFAVRQVIVARLWAQEKYEDMTNKQRNNIYVCAKNKEIKQRKRIINYLANLLLNSLAISEVNGTPEKRYQRIMEVATHRFDTLSEQDKERILIILDNK